ncbi:MAG: CUB domain-containing protein, partial [Aureispira sp.]
ANSGSFDDGSGTSNYQNNANCSWLIQPANGYTITLNFSQFNTENSFDFVRVYDGNSNAATLLGTFDGTSIPSSITSSGGAMLVEFTSDGSVTRSGWAANYTTNAPVYNIALANGNLSQSNIVQGDLLQFNIDQTYGLLSGNHSSNESVNLEYRIKATCSASGGVLVATDNTLIGPTILSQNSTLSYNTAAIAIGNYALEVTGNTNTPFSGQESTTTDNSYCIPFAIVAPPVPDLTLTNNAISLPSNTLGDGATTTISYIVANIGNANALASSTEIVLSTDAIWDATDNILNTESTLPIAAGSNQSLSSTITIPSGTPAGTYYLLFIADASNQINESDEQNNRIAIPITVVNYVISVNPDTLLNVSDTGAILSANITSNDGWTAVANDSWINVNPANGTGNGLLSIVVAPNTNAIRTGSITLTTTHGQTATIIIVQDSAVMVVPVNSHLIVDDANGTTGSVVSIPIRMNQTLTNVTSIQGHFIIADTAIAQFLTANYVTNITINGASTGNFNLIGDEVRFVWYDFLGGQTLNQGQVLFHLEVELLGPSGSQTTLDFMRSGSFVLEVTQNLIPVTPFSTNFGNITIDNNIRVTGNIHTEAGIGVAFVTVDNRDLTNNTTSSSQTNNHGDYAFGNVQPNLGCELTPHKNTGYTNGISAMDLGLGQNYLLGYYQINSPYKIIALDANSSGAITASDLAMGRALLLNNLTTLPKSWRFIPASYVFPNPADPFASGFPEQEVLNNLTRDTAVDFIAVKVLDVSGNANPNLLPNYNRGTQASSLSIKSSRAAALEFDQVVTRQGNEVLLNIYAGTHFTNVIGGQFSLDLVSHHTSFATIETHGVEGFEAYNFNMDTTQHLLHYVNYREQSTNYQKGDLLFSIRLNVNGAIDLSQALVEFNYSRLYAEVYHGQNLQLSSLELVRKSGLVNTFNLATPPAESLIVAPNPFDLTTILRYNTTAACNIQLTIFDLLGQEVYSCNKSVSRGEQELLIEAKDLNHVKGIYSYQLRYQDNIATGKIQLQ